MEDPVLVLKDARLTLDGNAGPSISCTEYR
jgi:hypothetical protein